MQQCRNSKNVLNPLNAKASVCMPARNPAARAGWPRKTNGGPLPRAAAIWVSWIAGSRYWHYAQPYCETFDGQALPQCCVRIVIPKQAGDQTAEARLCCTYGMLNSLVAAVPYYNTKTDLVVILIIWLPPPSDDRPCYTTPITVPHNPNGTAQLLLNTPSSRLDMPKQVCLRT